MPFPVVQGVHDARVTEPDDVGSAIAGQVGEKAGMIASPPSAVRFECDQLERRCAESSWSSVEATPNAVRSDPQDIGAAVAGEIHDETRMF